MRTITLLIAMAVLLYALSVSSQERGYTLGIGRFGATDDELGQCYFSVGLHASLALHPKGEPCVLTKELIGRTGKLIFVPD